MDCPGGDGLAFPASSRIADVLAWAGIWGALPEVPPSWFSLPELLRDGWLRRVHLVHGLGLVPGRRLRRRIAKGRQGGTALYLSKRALLLWAAWRLAEEGRCVVRLHRLRLWLEDGGSVVPYPGRAEVTVGWEGIRSRRVDLRMPLARTPAVGGIALSDVEWLRVAPLVLDLVRTQTRYSPRLLLHGVLALAAKRSSAPLMEFGGEAFRRGVYRFAKRVPEGTWEAIAQKLPRWQTVIRKWRFSDGDL